MLNAKVVTLTAAIWTTVTFLLCVGVAMLAPSKLYMHALLPQVLPGFEWGSATGFLIGLAESILYGAYGGLLFASVYNVLQRKWAR